MQTKRSFGNSATRGNAFSDINRPQTVLCPDLLLPFYIRSGWRHPGLMQGRKDTGIEADFFPLVPLLLIKPLPQHQVSADLPVQPGIVAVFRAQRGGKLGREQFPPFVLSLSIMRTGIFYCISLAAPAPAPYTGQHEEQLSFITEGVQTQGQLSLGISLQSFKRRYQMSPY